MMNANDLSMGVTCTDVCVTIGADKLLNNVKLRAEPGTITWSDRPQWFRQDDAAARNMRASTDVDGQHNGGGPARGHRC